MSNGRSVRVTCVLLKPVETLGSLVPGLELTDVCPLMDVQSSLWSWLEVARQTVLKCNCCFEIMPGSEGLLPESAHNSGGWNSFVEISAVLFPLKMSLLSDSSHGHPCVSDLIDAHEPLWT